MAVITIIIEEVVQEAILGVVADHLVVEGDLIPVRNPLPPNQNVIGLIHDHNPPDLALVLLDDLNHLPPGMGPSLLVERRVFHHKGVPVLIIEDLIQVPRPLVMKTN